MSRREGGMHGEPRILPGGGTATGDHCSGGGCVGGGLTETGCRASLDSSKHSDHSAWVTPAFRATVCGQGRVNALLSAPALLPASLSTPGLCRQEGSGCCCAGAALTAPSAGAQPRLGLPGARLSSQAALCIGHAGLAQPVAVWLFRSVPALCCDTGALLHPAAPLPAPPRGFHWDTEANSLSSYEKSEEAGPQSHGQPILGRWSEECAEVPVPICIHYTLPCVTVPGAGRKVYLASVQSPPTVKPEPVTTFHHSGESLHSVLLRTALRQPGGIVAEETEEIFPCYWALGTKSCRAEPPALSYKKLSRKSVVSHAVRAAYSRSLF
ncbi:uncharacterized protein LOC128853033 [Cuculus canorus]|uniref:uncharacterized protein LOC128853033 n=1 Tax=Cuculus canorus TaxID=55661 RepID=UPI0023AABE9D|nr:uncharacterized protein LOC128853033 [Cuculus canorus]